MTGRKEVVVGWYHSHPGFGCWMSGVDQNTQKSFEMLHERAVAVVVDPVQSVKGKVVIDAFRLIKQQMMMRRPNIHWISLASRNLEEKLPKNPTNTVS